MRRAGRPGRGRRRLPQLERPDSDGDGIADAIEVGADCGAPRDNDSDGAADYEDTDSDNDGALDLSPTINAILESILGDASPAVLSTVPIAASLTVARDHAVVPRSRVSGWDYRAASNAIVFFNRPFDLANPSDVVVSYRRWADQI